MRTHSGLHVVCGVIFRDFQALATGSNMEPLVGRIDFNLPEIPPGFKEDVEAAINAEIVADRPIVARVLPRAEALAIPNVVKTQAELVPEDVDELRLIDVVGLDIQTDGGTHVASTSQIGQVEVVKVESKGRANRRLRLRVHD
jgi:misacylated tRNA(Ala) deacylase